MGLKVIVFVKASSFWLDVELAPQTKSLGKFSETADDALLAACVPIRGLGGGHSITYLVENRIRDVTQKPGVYSPYICGCGHYL